MSIHSKNTAYNQADVAIVGGGVMGLSIARQLALSRAGRVVVIERGELSQEASYAAGGILAPQAEADAIDDFFELACLSRDMYPSLAAELLDETGIDVELDTTGTLCLAFNEHDLAEISKRYTWQSRAGLPVERLTSVEARQLEPSVSDRVCGALRLPRDIQVENRKLLTALIAACKKLGVHFQMQTSVSAVRIEHERVTGLETSAGSVNAAMVIIAAGSWTSFIKLPGFNGVPVEPVRGQMLCFRTRETLARHVLYSPRGYLVPRRDGRLLVGSTAEHVGFDNRWTPEGVALIMNNATEIVPLIARERHSDVWSGLRPRAEDGLPVIGSSQLDGLFYATGHYRNGILLAPVTARLIADEIIGNVHSAISDRFSPKRFELATVV